MILVLAAAGLQGYPSDLVDILDSGTLKAQVFFPKVAAVREGTLCDLMAFVHPKKVIRCGAQWLRCDLVCGREALQTISADHSIALCMEQSLADLSMSRRTPR